MTIITERRVEINAGNYNTVITSIDEEYVALEQDGSTVYVPRSHWRTLVREVRQLMALENVK